MSEILSKSEELRLRELARDIVQAIEPAEKILQRLGFSAEDYAVLSTTRTFRAMLIGAQSEWDGATNIQKRIKTKAAVNIEEALPHMFAAMTNEKEALSSKVKAFEILSKVAGLGTPEPVAAGGGQYFNLQINLGPGIPALTFSNAPPTTEVIDGNYEIATAEEIEQIIADASASNPPQESYPQSKLLDNVLIEDL